jgi:hypothetical protein
MENGLVKVNAKITEEKLYELLKPILAYKKERE